MDILLKEVTVIDPASDFHQQQVDVFVQNGFLTEIGEIERPSDQTISLRGLHVSPGFTDVF
ncbi:MAG TPA: dihydroorotase, partial [Flavisolibacter sp.]|nr:dihydroorotase [Flavisolibacter sp.]